MLQTLLFTEFTKPSIQLTKNIKVCKKVCYKGGFHLHLLGFPFVYQFELQIELEPNLLVQNPVELIISPTFQIVLISCVT